VTPSSDVVIVGAGIAGLAAGYELGRLGVRYLVFEQAPRAGGVILSEQIGDYVIDAGPDSLLVQKRDGIELAEELGLGPRLIPTSLPRLAYVQRRGRLHALPEASVLGVPTRVAPFLKSRLFTWSGKLRMGAELFVPPRRDARDESIGRFMTRRFGREATDYLAEPLLAGIHAGDVNRLSTASLFPRFIEAERTSGSLLKAFRRGSTGPRAAGGAFRSLPGGLSELVAALTARIPDGALRLGTAVSRIAQRSAVEPFRVETASGDVLSCRALVLATPAFVTAELIRPLDEELARLCAEVPYASTATIALAFPRAAVEHPLNGSGFVVPRLEGTGILAASWLSSKWAGRAPADRALMRVFVGGARDPDALDHTDDQLVDRALSAIRPLLGVSGAPLLSRVYRWRRSSPQHEVGHRARLEAIERRLAGHIGLFVTGSGFRGVGIPDCVADGRATARQAARIVPVQLQ
jgi:oxygen-dependent protoporphyrinogen oxidase